MTTALDRLQQPLQRSCEGRRENHSASRQVAEPAKMLGARFVIGPLHVHGWRHLTEGCKQIESAFAERGEQAFLVLLTQGQWATLQSSPRDREDRREEPV